ncbi:uncharacterized protein BJ212DRAFT_1278098, partial [Suillus subaureus]
TTDVHTIFVKKNDYVDPHTGLVESGHMCTVCQKNGVATRQCFFKGSMSTLCTHISRQVFHIKYRHRDHIKVYQEHCKKLGIPLNERACPSHYIHTQPDKPNDCKLQTEQLAFSPIEGCHTGANMANLLVCTVDWYSLHPKASFHLFLIYVILNNNQVGWFTCDNALSNDTCLDAFAGIINANKDAGAKMWDPVQGHAALKHAQLEGKDVDLDALEADLEDVDVEGDQEEEDDNDEEFGVGDTIGKALALGINLFVELTDNSENVPNLKGKSYADFQLDRRDWEKLKLMHEVLQEPASATQTFSSSCNPSVWQMIPVLEFLQKSWENMAKLPQFSKVSDAIQKALENVVKWYHKTKDTNIYFICLGMFIPFHL